MTPSDPGARAKVIISFDFEIGWGDVTNPMWRTREGQGIYRRLREVLPRLLSTLDETDIPVTWATVGAMIDDPAHRKLDHLPKRARGVVAGALEEGRADTFDGRDLFDLVRNARAGHAIACHSYSHVPFDYEGVDAGFVAADLAAFHETLASHGLDTDRLVYPENTVRFEHAVADSGIRLARTAARDRFTNRWLYLATIPFIPPPLAAHEPAVDGLVHQSGSMLYADHAQTWRVPLLKRRFALGLKAAIRQGGTLHLWAHPFNFAASPALLEAFSGSLHRLARLRDAGTLTVEPM